MISHLTSYGLEHIFDLTKYFQPFSARTHMLLNANTLSSLEIYKNQTDYTETGSLFWCVDRTKTRFGKRLLRNWVGRPLLDKAMLEARLEAVEEVLERKNANIEKLKTLLGKVQYDLEKGLIRIYYGRANRPELLAILQALRRIASEFPIFSSPSDAGFRSTQLNRAMASLPLIRADVEGFLDVFNHQAAAKDDKYNFFKDELGEYDDIASYKCLIADDEHELNEHLKEIAAALGVKKKVYCTVAGIEYLIEVDNNKKDLSKVPASWIKVSGYVSF
jgi:DNA mismatch repair protein MSH3